MARVGGRAHIEVRGIHRADAHDLREAVESALRSRPAVEAVETLAVLGRVAVAFDEDASTVDELIDVIEAVEEQQGVAGETFPSDRPEHPGDVEPSQRDLFALGADTLALGAAVVGRLARLARLPTEAAGLVSFAQSQARVREALEGVVGPGPADVVLAVSGATAQGLAQGPLGLVVDGAHRAALLAESRARVGSWRRREHDLAHGRPPPEVHDRPGRPVPIPAGPVEHYERRALVAAGGAFVSVGLGTRSLRRAAAATLVTTPKAVAVGRDVFAAHLGRMLADRDAVVLDRAALRRLDRVDTVVLDAPALVRSGAEIERVMPLEGFDPAVVAARVRGLFRPDKPHVARRRRGAQLERLPKGETLLAIRRARRELGEPRDLLLLTIDGTPAALVSLGNSVAGETAQVVGAARHAGHMLVVAGDEALSRRVGADLFVDGGDHLVRSIRMLQEDGAVPLLVSRRSGALAAADVGITVVESDGPVPWGADILMPGWEDARLLIEASAVAHEVSRQSAAIALTGSSMGALSMLGGQAVTATSRAMTAINGAALLAVANGTRASIALGRRPRLELRRAVPWHELDIDDALQRAASRREGLTSAQAAERAAADARQPGPSFFRGLVDELANPLTPVLAGASVLAASIGSFTDAALIAGVTAVNGTLGAVQRFQVERAVRGLEHDNRQQVRVRRDGSITVVGARHLVVGDVVLLDAGSLVPADCRILKSVALEVDESALTGESLPVAKSVEPVIAASPADRTSMLYAGSTVAAGTVEALVVAVGADTEAGAAEIGESVSTGGVEARLRDLTRISIPASVIGGAAVSVAGLLRGVPLPAAAQTGVSLAVAAVPEGLPALATVAQLSAARRLSGRGALVRNPRAIEALGRVDVLCADKTGTMTEGRIELSLVSDGQRAVRVSAGSAEHRAIVAAAVAASPRERPGRPLRHLTDRAVLDAAPAWGVVVGQPDRVHDLPFEPRRGYHAAVEHDGDGNHLYVKGAPDKLLPRCVAWRRAGGAVPIARRERHALERHVEELGSRGFRVLAVAQRQTSGAHELADDRVRNLELLGFLALADPVRPAAAGAAASLRHAGVHIVMVTGDHPSTAQGIAEELGILEAGRVLTGADLDVLDDNALDLEMAGVAVFARITPSQKVRIVQAYQRQGRVVAMAGDGANDAAAIRLADVGIALGENTTSATRNSADLLIPDGRVDTILDALIEGRAMWSSVRDAVALLLGGNLGEVAFTVASAVLSGRSPLSARQLLLVNLLTDTVPALAIALRPPKATSADALLREGPEASLGASLERAIWVRGAATAGAATAAWAGARLTAQGPRTGTVTLVGLVSAQLGQTLTAGGRDPRVLAASLGSMAAMAAIVETPGVSQLFGCQPLDPLGWAIGIGAGALGTAAASLGSLLLAPRPNGELDPPSSARVVAPPHVR